MPYKDPEKRKEYHKKYNKQHYKNNPEYYTSDKRIKLNRISNWRSYGVISEDYDKLYEYYLSIQECENCGIELNQDEYTRKCLDHCHTTGKFRNILCHCCNVSRG